MSLLGYGMVAWLGFKLANLLINLLGFPVLRESREAPARGVSLLIPARNEAHNLEQTLKGFLAQEVDEILVLDDGSSDATPQVVARAALQDPRLRLISGAPKPEGWMGKTWACQQLAEAARGGLLIFTDADVRWKAGGVRALVGAMTRERADLFSVYPRQITPTLPERVLLPLIDDVLMGYLPYPLLKTPFPSAAAANGQVMAFRREAYWACGGHAGVRGEVLEDVRLAQRLKASGGRLRLALGDDLIGVRMYRTYAEIVEGLGKNLIEFHGKSRVGLALSYALHLLGYTLCWPLALLNPLWLAVGGMGLLERFLLGLKTGRPGWEVVLMPLAPILSTPIYLHAWQRDYVWKGRVYSR
ncbi:glycosyltransferase [Meiothermus ruber]|uniref:glycosyltransferase n=1 Tax=Meiothermus ruber TaxID=277 RepID=UPI0023F90296|nr:glycosyltransferase family 2 protein [Meiothermus ruber]